MVPSYDQTTFCLQICPNRNNCDFLNFGLWVKDLTIFDLKFGTSMSKSSPGHLLRSYGLDYGHIENGHFFFVVNLFAVLRISKISLQIHRNCTIFLQFPRNFYDFLRSSLEFVVKPRNSQPLEHIRADDAEIQLEKHNQKSGHPVPPTL